MSSPGASEKDIPIHNEVASEKHAIHTEDALHLEVLMDDYTAERLAQELKLVDSSKAQQLHEELERSKQNGYVPLTPEEWKAHHSLNRKMDILVVPFVALIYLFCGLDRSNLGNAATDNITEDLGIPADTINTATSLFFATYCPFMPLGAALGRRMGQTYFLAVAGFIWGALTLSQAFCKTQAEILAIRLMIGIAEAGFYSTATSYISLFYPRFNLAFRMAIFYFAYAIAGGFGGLIAYSCFTIQGNLKGWQYLFIVEGVCSMGIALITPFWLPKGPGTAWFLKEHERAYANKRMIIDSAANLAPTNQASRRDIVEAFKDWKMWIMFPWGICTNMGPAGFSIFLPIIVKGLGYSGAMANLMSVPPYVAGAILCLVFCRSSDHFRERTYHLLTSLALVILGLALAIGLPLSNVHARYGGLVILLSGTFVSSPVSSAWLAGNTPEPGKRTIILALSGWSNFAGIISSEVFQSKYGPDYKFSLTISLILLSIAFVGYIFVNLSLRWSNRRKAKIVANMTPEELQAENLSDVRYGDKKYTFTYGL